MQKEHFLPSICAHLLICMYVMATQCLLALMYITHISSGDEVDSRISNFKINKNVNVLAKY